MKRVLCLRFPNWSVQRLQRLRAASGLHSIALYTPPPDSSSTKSSRRKRVPAATAGDLKFVRELYPSARSGPAIVAVSPDAWSAGVRPGMPLAEARSMAAPFSTSSSIGRAPAASRPVTEFLEWSPADDRTGLLEAAEWTRSFAPIVSLDELPVPDGLLLDITGCGPLFGGESVLAEQLFSVMRRRGYRCRIAISDSVAAAWAFAHADTAGSQKPRRTADSRRSSSASSLPTAAEWNLPVVIIPPGQSLNYLQPLPLPTSRLPLSDVQILSQLGILNIAQLLSLPVEDLPSRVSATTVKRIRQLQGIEAELLTSIPEADPVAANWTSEFPATNLDEVRQVLEHLTEIVVRQLQRRHLGATRLTCQLKLESGVMLPLSAETVRPVQSASHLMDVLTLKLDSLRLAEPASAVRMQATVSPMPVAKQQDLFSTTEHLQPQEELATLLDRLSSRLGSRAVLTAELHDDARPEHSVTFQPVIAMAEDTSPSTSTTDRIHDLVTPDESRHRGVRHQPRPLLLLPEPEPIGAANQDPRKTGFVSQGRRHVVESCVGPERIQTAWWDDGVVHRDYYRVRTTNGLRFWIFQDLSDESWWIHGVFD
ncbi:MAG: DNA polymerase Y family protein [Planctomycetaceae bacterium]